MNTFDINQSLSPPKRKNNIIPTTVQEIATSAQSQISADPKTPPSKQHKLESDSKLDIESPFTEIVWVKIGTDSTPPFGVHKAKLFQESTFFRDAFNNSLPPSGTSSDWSLTLGAGSKVLHLPNEDPDVFQRFNTYLYEQKRLTGPNEKVDALSWPHLFDVYMFGLKYKIGTLQNAIIDTSIRKYRDSKSLPLPHEIGRLYKLNVKAAKYRLLFIDLFTWHEGLYEVLSGHPKYPSQFLTGVLMKMYELKVSLEQENPLKRPRFRKSERAFYYVYGEMNPVNLDEESLAA